MVEAHRYLAYAVIAGCLLAGVVGLVAYRRGAELSGATIHLLALPQTLLVAQAAFGLLLLSGDYRAADRAALRLRSGRARRRPLAVVLRAGRPAAAPALVRGLGARRRGARRSWHHDGIVRRFFAEPNRARPRDRRPDRARRRRPLARAGARGRRAACCGSRSSSRSRSSSSSSGASAAATSRRGRTARGACSTVRSCSPCVDVGAAIGLSPTGADAIAFFVVLGCCAWAVVAHLARRAHLRLSRLRLAEPWA